MTDRKCDGLGIGKKYITCLIIPFLCICKKKLEREQKSIITDNYFEVTILSGRKLFFFFLQDTAKVIPIYDSRQAKMGPYSTGII